MDLFSLKGKVIIVTGGAGYYGRPIVWGLAEAGATVIIASRNELKCKNLASEINAANLNAAGYFLDLANEDSIKNLVQQVVVRYQKIDVLVNNAVSREGFKDLQKISKEEWENAQKINSTGLMLITKNVIDVMCRNLSGNVINIGSIQGVVGPNFSVYQNTQMTSPINYTYDKWGMVGFTKWIANYYGKYNIRANCISPGGYGPGVAENAGINEFTQKYKQLTPLGRFAEDDDIKGPIVFLASEASSYITGHNLLVDGGWTSW